MANPLVKEISFQTMLKQLTVLPNKLDVVLLQAKIKLGTLYTKSYKESFEIKRFIGSGDPWPERKRNYIHPMMKETGSLQYSINWQPILGGIMVYTNEGKYNPPKNNRSRTYAAFHNDPTGTHGYNVQRKFIGDSKFIENQAVDILSNLLKKLDP